MSFASPDIAYTTHPTDALFSAHFKSSVLMAVYLIGGAALCTAALVGVAYTAQLRGPWALLPYALMATMLLWFGLGAWVINKQKQRVQHCDRSYNAYLQRHVQTAPPSVEDLTSDEPWELRAFWGHYGTSPATPPAPSDTDWAFVQAANVIANARAPRPSRATAAAHDGTAATLEVDLIASMTEHKPLRPISLFGSVQ